MTIEKVVLGKFVDEVRERLGSGKKTIYSVTNQRGFIPALETFGKQVFSEDTSNYKVVGLDDLAFNPSRINVGSVALCPDANGGAVSPMYTIVRCREGLLPEYLLYFLRSPIGLAEINHRTEGAVRFQLKFADLQRIPVYLPSVPEQERIVRILDEADELRRLRGQADLRTADLIPAIFDEMFGDPATNPKGLTETSIRDVAEIIVPTRDKPKSFSGSVPWITLPDLDGLFVDTAKNCLTHEEAAQVGNRFMPKNTVLISCAGSLGRIAVTTREVYANQQFYGLVAKSQVIDPVFMASSLKILGERFFHRIAGAATLAFFSKDKALTIKILRPPLPLQQQFAARVAEVRQLEESQAASRRHLDALFDSLQHWAFRGEL